MSDETTPELNPEDLVRLRSEAVRERVQRVLLARLESLDSCLSSDERVAVINGCVSLLHIDEMWAAQRGETVLPHRHDEAGRAVPEGFGPPSPARLTEPV